ncbi:hypothetical protein IQ07DRAFT_668651 [Pyrenochaeta sp. DS3sAY3a]|nr:hypothetical protein IQ07DRAFT_668651 [Pyrenochaeta sp. DS3sAY3a]
MSCVTCRSRKLRCDRQRPLCAACGKSNRECTYLERQTVVRRRSKAKTLEARLALLEARLGMGIDMISGSSDSAATANGTEDTIQETDSHEKSSVKTSALSLNADDDYSSSTTSQNGDCSPPIDEHSTSQEILVYSSVEEILPPAEVQQELFYTTLKLGPDLGPPLCLQHSMWCLSSSVTPKYAGLCEGFHQKARRYAEISEAKLIRMKGTDEAFTVYYAQCWHLVATFEAQRMYITRAWMSAGKCVRLVQMMGLHRIDKHGSYIGTIPKAKSFIELEERRRTFWAAYLSDRFASRCSGWPMAINEHEVWTKPNPSETPGHSEFWDKHRELDTSILNMFIHLPDQFKVPAGADDTSVVFLNMALHTATICLHQAAMKTALKYYKGNGFMVQSMNRCITAADAITMAARRIKRNDLSRVSLWSGFCLFMAGVVYCYDLKLNRLPYMQSQPSLVFLQQALGELGNFHSLAQFFKTQLKAEIVVLRGDQHHGAGGGTRKQLNSLRPKNTNCEPHSSNERATSMAEYHFSMILGGLLQHDTDDTWAVQEEDIDRFPHTNEHVLDTKLQRQRSDSRAQSSPGKEQNRGLQPVEVLPTQRDMTSINDYDLQNITTNFTTTFTPWQGLTIDANW